MSPVPRARRRLFAAFATTAIVFALVTLPTTAALASTPPSLTNPTQSDVHGAIASGGITNETAITFGGEISDADSDDVRLTVEVRSVGAPFNGSATDLESAFSPPGTHSVVVNLAPGNYDWQAQAEDVNGDVSGWVAGDTFRVNAPPNDPANLAQESDGNVTISPGGVTNDSTPTFSGTVTDPDNDPTQTDTLQLEVEVKAAGSANFDGTGTHTSSAVNDNQTASVTWPALGPGTYHWRARTVDVNTATSGWQNFGSILTVTDVRVNAPPNDPDPIDQQDSGGSLPIGAKTNDTSITFTGKVSDPDNPSASPADTIAIQVEVNPVGIAFDGTTNVQTSNFVAEGQTATTTFTGLIPGTSYHWRIRANDNNGGLSGWTSFGLNGDPNGVDFRIRQANLALTQSFNPSPAKASAITSASSPSTVTRTVTIDFVVSNGGPDEATGFTITDALNNTILDASSATYCEGGCPTSSPYTGSITSGTLNSGSTRTFHITANIRTSPSPLTGGTALTLSNSPTLASPTFDNDLSNNAPTTPTVQVQTVPGAPTDVQAFAGNESAVVRWVAPAGTGGSPITQYKVTVTSSNGGAIVGPFFTTATQLSIGDDVNNLLTNEKKYIFLIQAENSVGLSSSAASNEITPSQNESAEIFSSSNQSQQTGEGAPSAGDPLVAKQLKNLANDSIGTIDELLNNTNTYGINPATFCGNLPCVNGEVVVTKLTDFATNRYLVDIIVAKGVAVGTGKKLVWFDATPGTGPAPVALDSCPKTIPTLLDACVVKVVSQPALNPALLVEISVRLGLIDPAAGLRK
jgi:hypothetical protein